MNARTEGRPLVLVMWVILLPSVLWAVTSIGEGPMSSPPIGDVDAVRGWYDRRAPHEALIAVARLAVLATGWYLLAITVVGMLARLARAARLVRLADRLTVAPVRRILHAGIGIGLAVTTAAAPMGQAAASEPVAQADAASDETGILLPPALAVPVRGAEATTKPESLLSRVALPVANMPGDDQPRQMAMPAIPAASEPSTTRSAQIPATHVVEAGEHLWSVAERIVAAAFGDENPAEADVASYWRTLVDHNRDRLPDPHNPDLVHPGLEITLPPPEA